MANTLPYPLTDEQVLAAADGEDEIILDNMDALYAYYTHPSLGTDMMPYGTAKARTGDPDQWIAEQIDKRAAIIRFFTDTSHESVTAMMARIP